jgi:predicted N-acetyltransferase YhbS
VASGAIDVGSLPAKLAKKPPRHPVPILLLARLAVDRSVHGRGLGSFLLQDALARTLDLSERLGIHAIVVDALDAEAKAFYERFGFLPLRPIIQQNDPATAVENWIIRAGAG